MSNQLLWNLNGSNKGALCKWLNDFQGEPRIAWYPSAGKDFKDLLHLHPGFSEQMPAKDDPACPDLFLHSDYFPDQESTFLDSPIIYCDDQTSISVNTIEELPRCDLPLDDKIVESPKDSAATGRVLFLKVEVKSKVLGSFTAPVIYAFVENSAFCAQRILPNKGKFSHIIHVRYGGGCGGGGKSTGIWLLNVLRRLGCECFVTDGHFNKQPGDEQIYALYPDLSGAEDTNQLNPIRVLPCESWSGHGDVSWNIVKPV